VLTGLQPSQTGVLSNEMLWYDQVDPADTLPAVLKAAGVHVAMFGKNFHEEPILPEHQAVMFDEFLYPPLDGDAGAVARDDLQHGVPFRSHQQPPGSAQPGRLYSRQ
jgi:arylsulfatase A-like enzyme